MPAGGSQAPTFAVSALMDAGWEGHPGATLQRVQIIKGWVDAAGNVREKVHDMTGSATPAPVDPATCTPSPVGPNARAQLCATWKDPDFDPNLHAFYYARVLENPSCRWNQYYCNDRGVDCSQPPKLGADQVGYNAYEYQQCCGEEGAQNRAAARLDLADLVRALGEGPSRRAGVLFAAGKPCFSPARGLLARGRGGAPGDQHPGGPGGHPRGGFPKALGRPPGDEELRGRGRARRCASWCWKRRQGGCGSTTATGPSSRGDLQKDAGDRQDPGASEPELYPQAMALGLDDDLVISNT